MEANDSEIAEGQVDINGINPLYIIIIFLGGH